MYTVACGSVTVTIERTTNSATLSRMNLSGYVGHILLNVHCCVLLGLGLGLDLVSGWLAVMQTYVYYF